jgi:hypothetical protein
MNQAGVIYHLARADFLERVRRYSFLTMLGLVIFLGYQVAVGNVSLRVGSMMSIMASFFLGSMGHELIDPRSIDPLAAALTADLIP